jgi:hypothetical protein
MRTGGEIKRSALLRRKSPQTPKQIIAPPNAIEIRDRAIYIAGA